MFSFGKFIESYKRDGRFVYQTVLSFVQKAKNIKYIKNRFLFNKSQQLNFISDFSSFYQTSNAKSAAQAIIDSVDKAGDAPLKKYVAKDILDALNNGYEVSDGMVRWFDSDALQIYRAGEKAGRIQKVLSIYAEQFQQIKEFKKSLISKMKLGIYMASVGLIGLIVLAKGDWLNFPKIKPVSQWDDVSQYAYELSYMLNDNIHLSLLLIIVYKLYVRFLRSNTSDIRMRLDDYFPLSIFKGLEALRFMKMLTVLKNAHVGDYAAIRIIHENSCEYLRYYTEEMQANLNTGHADLFEVLDVGLLPPRLMSRIGSVAKASGNEAKLNALMVVSEYAEQEISFAMKKASFYLATLGWVIGGYLMGTLLVGFVLTTLSLSSM